MFPASKRNETLVIADVDDHKPTEATVSPDELLYLERIVLYVEALA